MPDPMKSWAVQVATSGEVMNLRSDAQVVLVSSPPHGVQAAGIALHQAWGTPYVADLRDDWVGNHRIRWLTPLHKSAARRMERTMGKEASLILANTVRMRSQFVARHPQIGAKVATLTNGFNESDFAGLQEEEAPGGRLRLGYFGSAYNGYVAAVLDEMQRQWVLAGHEEHWDIRAHTDRAAAPVRRVCSASVTHFPLLPARQAAAAMNRCHALLLLMPPGEREPSPTVPLKAYSYLRTGLPIVYSGERGATTELLAQFPGTFSLPRCSGAELARFLTAQRNAWGKRYPREGISRYSFEFVGAQLEQTLREMVDAQDQRATVF